MESPKRGLYQGLYWTTRVDISIPETPQKMNILFEGPGLKVDSSHQSHLYFLLLICVCNNNNVPCLYNYTLYMSEQQYSLSGLFLHRVCINLLTKRSTSTKSLQQSTTLYKEFLHTATLDMSCNINMRWYNYRDNCDIGESQKKSALELLLLCVCVWGGGGRGSDRNMKSVTELIKHPKHSLYTRFLTQSFLSFRVSVVL